MKIDLQLFVEGTNRKDLGIKFKSNLRGIEARFGAFIEE